MLAVVKMGDYFVSVARIGKTDIPIVFAIRTIDADSRSQIYSIAAKKPDYPPQRRYAESICQRTSELRGIIGLCE